MSAISEGNIDISECDDANIPVNSFILEPDADSQKWRWTADNFMPRRGRVSEGEYSIEADTKEELVALVNRHVVPLYEAALANLKSAGACYYWKARPAQPNTGTPGEGAKP